MDLERRGGRTLPTWLAAVRNGGGRLAAATLILTCGAAPVSLGMPTTAGADLPDGRLVRYVMTAPASGRYTTGYDGAVDPASRRLLSSFPTLRLSPCLSRAAAAYARLVPHGARTQPPLASIEFLLHWAGCPDPSATATVLYTTEDGTAEVANGIRRLLAQPEVEAATDLGVARVPAENPPFRWRWGILAVERTVQIKSFPASGSPDAALPLQFRLVEGLADPGVILLGTDGRIEHRAIGHAGRWGLARIPLGPRKGTLWVEITAKGPTGPRVCALFPVTVGGPPPDVWEGTLPPDESAIRTHTQAEALMLELVNSDRRRFGLPLLRADAHLAAIARRHSQDMADHGYFGHVSPSQGGLAARLAGARYAIQWSGENISRSDSVYESEEALMRSPGHRANILAPQPTVVGIGIVRDRAVDRRMWVVTQIFALPVTDISAQAFADAARARVNRHRADHGGVELRPNATIETAAEQLAARLHGAALARRELMAEARRTLLQAGVGYHRLSVFTYQVPDPDEITLPDEIDGANVEAVGIGAAHQTGEPLTTVVILVLEGRVETARP